MDDADLQITAVAVSVQLVAGMCMAAALTAYCQQRLQPAHGYGWRICHEACHNSCISLHGKQATSVLQVIGLRAVALLGMFGAAMSLVRCCRRAHMALLLRGSCKALNTRNDCRLM
jgi:hypothetical protein